MTSCEKETPETPKPPSAQSTIEMPDFSVENGLLKFESEADVEKAAQAVIMGEMSGVNQLEVTKSSTGFKSMMDVFYDAIDEMDAIETMEGVQAFRAKYKDIFLFSDDPEDNCHYLPVSISAYARLASPEGYIIIGGETKSLKDLDSYRETMAYKSQVDFDHSVATTKVGTMARPYEKGTNWLFIWPLNKNHKTWSESYKIGDWIYTELTAQSKGTFGWNHHTTDFYLATMRYGGEWDVASRTGFNQKLGRYILIKSCKAHHISNIEYIKLAQPGTWGVNCWVDISVYTSAIGFANSYEYNTNFINYK